MIRVIAMDDLAFMVRRAVVEVLTETEGPNPSPELVASYVIDKLRWRILVTPELDWTITKGQRKAWDGKPDLTEEGWIPFGFSRMEFHEERSWFKVRSAPPAFPPPTGPPSSTTALQQ